MFHKALKLSNQKTKITQNTGSLPLPMQFPKNYCQPIPSDTSVISQSSDTFEKYFGHKKTKYWQDNIINETPEILFLEGGPEE